MSVEPHLQSINSSLQEEVLSSEFQLFPRLPKELRCQIWQHALQRHRVINVHLSIVHQIKKFLADAERIPIPSAGERSYRVIVDGFKVLSKFLRINRESRDEALRFHRVHIPCNFTLDDVHNARDGILGTLYFNPEYDSLRVFSEVNFKHTVIEFLYHLKTTYDPKRVGLLKLVTDANLNAHNNFHQLRPEDFKSEVREVIFKALQQLQEVFFLTTTRVGRALFGPVLTHDGHDGSHFDRSLPVLPRSPVYERLPRDPRPVAENLKSVGMHDPRPASRLWFDLLARWHIGPTQTNYRIMLACDPYDELVDNASALKLLRKEEAQWKEGDMLGTGRKCTKCDNKALENVVRPAFGFWSLPLQALKPDTRSYQHPFVGMTYYDISEYWPELWLGSLN
jgi:hypothetical protein